MTQTTEELEIDAEQIKSEFKGYLLREKCQSAAFADELAAEFVADYGTAHKIDTETDGGELTPVGEAILSATFAAAGEAFPG